MWLNNLKDSNEKNIQLKFQWLLYAIILKENEQQIVILCLEILFGLVNHYKFISFTLLNIIFYKLTQETDPSMQNIYLLFLPKLAVKKVTLLIVRITILFKNNEVYLYGLKSSEPREFGLLIEN